MDKETFQALLTKEVESYKSLLETKDNDWIIKGFIDVNKKVYTITNDTKVVSKIIEIILIPHLDAFAKENCMTLELPSAQNYYPDLTFKDGDGTFADLGEDVFDDYWMNFFNAADAKKAGIGKPRYNNIETYKKYLDKQEKIRKKLKK